MSSTGPQPTSVQAGLVAGKGAIITGASRGIGEAAARAFADAGAAVVLAARDEGALRGIADSIEAGGGQALAVPTDVTEPYAVQQLVDGTVDVSGGWAGGCLWGPPPPSEAGGGRALAVPRDVTEPYAVQQLVDGTVDVFGRLDVAF